MLRWISTLAVAVPMAGILYVLNIERVRRAYEYFLPDTSLPFDEFQAAFAAHKSGMMWQAIGWTGLAVFCIAAAAAALAVLHVRFAGGGRAGTRRHWLTLGYAVPVFCGVTVWLVSMMRV